MYTESVNAVLDKDGKLLLAKYWKIFISPELNRNAENNAGQ
jgi:hypothetical protein